MLTKMHINKGIHNNGGGVADVVLLFVLGSKLFSISFNKRPSSRVPTLGTGLTSLGDKLKLKSKLIRKLYTNN